MKKILSVLAAVVALSAAARAQQHEYQNDPWAEDAKEWECSFPKEIRAKSHKDPVYKTELLSRTATSTRGQTIPRSRRSM